MSLHSLAFTALSIAAAAGAAFGGTSDQSKPETIPPLVRAIVRPEYVIPLIPPAELATTELSDDERSFLLNRAAPWALDAATKRSVIQMESVVHSTVVRTAVSNQNVLVLKVLDAQGEIHRIVLDVMGTELDPDLIERESDAAAAKLGKIHPDLQDALNKAAPGEKIPILIWCRVQEDAFQPDRPTRYSKFDEAEETTLSEAQTAAAAIRDAEHTEPLLEQLSQLGLQAALVSGAPMVAARLDAAMIAEVARLDEVLAVYEDSVNTPMLNIARQAVGAHLVHNRGINGSGVRAAVIEAQGGRVNLNNPWLPLVSQDTSFSCGGNDHVDAVVGIFGSEHTTHRGIAPGAYLWVGGSCSGISSQIFNRIHAARQWGARVINLSWGHDTSSRVPNATARFIDNIVPLHGRTVVIAAGNRGSLSSPNVVNPAISYGGIAVGNFDDRGTASQSDDVIYSTSSFRDPISDYSDRPKPDLAAPGTRIMTLTNAAPWLREDINTGTSMACPVVAAAATLLIQRSSPLASWPESIKAILMATALNNTEGATRMSDRDGAGGINVNRADDVARGVNGDWGGVSYNCSAATQRDVSTIYLQAGRRVRVAIAWPTNTNFSAYANRPCADLDLRLVGPNGVTVTGSYSYDNTAELVEFVPATSGNYTIRVNKVRCDMSPGYLGFAWYQMP